MKKTQKRKPSCGGAATDNRTLFERIIDGMAIPGSEVPKDPESMTDHERMIDDQRRIKGLIYSVTTDLQNILGVLNNYQVLEPTIDTTSMKDRVMHFRMIILPQMVILKGDILKVLTDALTISRGLTSSLEKSSKTKDSTFKDDKYHKGIYKSHKEWMNEIEVRGNKYKEDIKPFDKVFWKLNHDLNVMREARLPEEGQANDSPNTSVVISRGRRIPSAVGELVPSTYVLPPRPPLLRNIMQSNLQLEELTQAIRPEQNNEAVYTTNNTLPLAEAVVISRRTLGRSKSRSRSKSQSRSRPRTGRL